MLSRRAFLVGSGAAARAGAAGAEFRVIDAHAHLGDFRIYAPNLHASANDLAAACDRHGIAKMFVSHATAIYYDPESGNRDVLQAARDFPARLLPAVAFPSPHHAGLVESLESFAKQGVRMLGELKIEKLSDPAAIGTLARAAELRMIVLAHADTEDAVAAAKAVPKARILVAHLGTGVSSSPFAWRNSIEAARRQPNVYFETCTSVVERGMIEESVRLLGPGRLVFGTDFPLLDAGVMMAKILDAKISDEARRMILAGNIERLLSEA